ncbi:MAG: cation:proton antiporter [Gammaproteobacteria bacterium]|nr:cation:proton antiporter [Gammaproteobacteria bacterium]MDX5375046.1 cation:proton antiporter [Gammaproteobacteria bacterium]
MHLDSFVTSALILLLVTAFAVALFKHFGLGSILGLLVAGIIVGPHSPGPSLTDHVEEVRHFTELGVVMLLFVIGLEMKPSRLWAMRREVLGLGSLQILITGAAIGAYFLLYQERWQAALLIGLTFALSSTAFVLQMLHERGEIASPQGKTAFSVLLMQDIAIVPLLAIVPIMSASGRLSSEVPLWQQILVVLGMLALIGVMGRYVLPWVLDRLARKGNKEGFLLFVIMTVFLAAWAMDMAGLSMALGAFLMGMLLSGSRYRLQVEAAIEPYKGLLMSMFFVAVGMSIDFKALAADPMLFAQHTMVIVAIKFTVLFLLALAFGYAQGLSARVAILLAQGGEFGFVLFGAAKALNVIDDGTFVIAVGVISVTMLATPLMVRLGDALGRQVARRRVKDSEPFEPVDAAGEQRVVALGGYGQVGHAVAVLLHSSGVPFVAFDTDPARVTQGQRDGFPVYFGDISDPDLLEAAHVGRAALVVLTIDKVGASLNAISHIRMRFPNLPIVARGRTLEDVTRLTEAGATHVFPEAMESSLRLGRLALEMIQVPDDEVDELLHDVRSGGYRLVSKESDAA